jgi:hypothetical protein
MAKKTFSNEFRIACRAAGVPGSAHGLRKYAAAAIANAGATDAQLMAPSWAGPIARWRRSTRPLPIAGGWHWKA